MLVSGAAVVHHHDFSGRCCLRYWLQEPPFHNIGFWITVAYSIGFRRNVATDIGFKTTVARYTDFRDHCFTILASGQLLLVILASGTTVLTSGTTVSRYWLQDNCCSWYWLQGPRSWLQGPLFHDNLLTVVASEGLLRNTGFRITVARNTGFRDHCCLRYWLQGLLLPVNWLLLITTLASGAAVAYNTTGTGQETLWFCYCCAYDIKPSW